MIEITLYIVFGLSILFPIYTYAIYPMVLKLLPRKKYETNSITPFISVIICFGNGNDEWKAINIKSLNYPNLEIISSRNINEAINKGAGDVLVFVDNETELDREALVNIIKPFADERIGLVVGEQTCKEGNSSFWKYETKVKSLESRIGSVSGANNTFFAVRKSKMFSLPDKVKNVSFFISTKVKQNKGDVVYCPEAKTYEKRSEGTNFMHHVLEAAGYWQAFALFWKMLFFRKGSFVYVSHRVMKWIVWLNLLIVLVSNILLVILFFNPIILSLLVAQLLYFLLCIFSRITKPNFKSRIFRLVFLFFRFGYYFYSLNLSFFLGLFGGGCYEKK